MNLGDYAWSRDTQYGKVRSAILANPNIETFEQWIRPQLRTGDLEEPTTLDEWESLFDIYRQEVLDSEKE
jgi:hypothetical protein